MNIDANELSRGAFENYKYYNQLSDVSKHDMTFKDISNISDNIIEDIFKHTTFLKHPDDTKYHNVNVVLMDILAWAYLNNINLNEILQINTNEKD